MGQTEVAVDSHVHVWTDDWDRYPLAPGFNPSDVKPAC